MEHPSYEVLSKLEPDALSEYAGRELTMSEVIALSTAISLRRLADAICNPANKYGESICEAVATAMREER